MLDGGGIKAVERRAVSRELYINIASSREIERKKKKVFPQRPAQHEPDLQFSYLYILLVIFGALKLSLFIYFI